MFEINHVSLSCSFTPAKWEEWWDTIGVGDTEYEQKAITEVAKNLFLNFPYDRFEVVVNTPDDIAKDAETIVEKVLDKMVFDYIAKNLQCVSRNGETDEEWVDKIENMINEGGTLLLFSTEGFQYVHVKPLKFEPIPVISLL